ncbi:MAG: hypothetical protein IJ335_10950 [Lachnospiraceae bacterium]|nr:hypothetical protein [Lachnospiraceae bacterium]
MSVNGITSSQATAAYSTQMYNSNKVKEQAIAEQTTQQKAESKTPETSATDTSGVIYEPSEAAKKYTTNVDLVAKMKADAEAQTAQLRSLVEQLMLKQSTSYANANDIWSFLREGDFTVDPATKAQAQADIAEDGYWGVNQTSDRIIDFANALTGGDPSKIEDMREAFKKGYEQAQETWGGELPEISKRTYEAVMEKFDKMAEEAKKSAETTEIIE